MFLGSGFFLLGESFVPWKVLLPESITVLKCDILLQ